jgi:acetyl-CoA carboxylase biotin carboxyl carrier protein
MNLKELKEIIDIVTSNESIEELEIEKSGVRLRIRRSSNHMGSVSTASVASIAASPTITSAPAPSKVLAEIEELFYIKSPIVGTFYTAPNPDSEPFVSVGDMVEKGSVLCIIEAMKLMNEIESEVAGEIVSVLVENGQPVEYGERLFAIRPR